MADKEFVFKQRNTLGYNVQIKLVDGRELQVSSKGKKTEQSYSVDILSLQNKSKKTVFVAWKWLISSISFLLLMLLLLALLPAYLDTNKNLYLAVILLTGVIGCVFCFVQFLKYTSRKQVFYSRKAHVPIIILSVDKPSKKTFSLFIGFIEKRIKKFRNHMDIDEDKQLTGEMKMLRRLSDEGVISKKDYENAKSKLFSGFDGNL